MQETFPAWVYFANMYSNVTLFFLDLNLLSFQLCLNAGCLFKKIELSESIRYAPGDPIESWLNGLLCLDVMNSIPHINRFGLDCLWSVLNQKRIFIIFIDSSLLTFRLPPPSECDLYYVNRDTLFSYHKESELFLQVITLYLNVYFVLT